MQIMRRAGRKITIELIDDLDGSVAGETVNFELDGKSYEIDLSPENARNSRRTLGQYVDRAEIDDLDDGIEGREGEFSDY